MTTPISVQLYSLREEAAVDFPGVLRRLGDVGFVGVELAGFHGLTAKAFSQIAGDSGLTVSSAHIGDLSLSALNTALDDIQSVGCATAVLAFLPPDDFAVAATIARRAEELNAAGKIAAERGVTIGYHNHWWEFENSFGGKTGWDLFVGQLEPEVVIELDMYWATVGGADPKLVIDELGDRLVLIHVKDGPADDPKAPMVAVGAGSVDIAGNLARATHAQWHVVELDRCATDMFTALEESYAFLTSQGLSRGRK
jgi:sugar phosphate isomerase/epimerase